MTTTTIAAPTGPPTTVPGRSLRPWQWARGNPVTAIGFVIIFGMAAAGLLAPIIAPYDPYALDPRLKLQEPSWSHPFGTGLFGEDIFSRVLYGIRIDFGIGIGAVGVGLVVASTVGALAGYLGGKVDEVAMRAMDIIAAFPGFILALAIAGALGPSIPNLIVAISFVNVPVYARLMRARFLVIRNAQYAMAAGNGARRPATADASAAAPRRRARPGGSAWPRSNLPKRVSTSRPPNKHWPNTSTGG